MPQTLLDNASRGTTSLLSSCVPSTTSDQLNAGSAPGDDTGDGAFNFGRKLRQWAADLNAMLSQTMGTPTAYTVSAAPGAGPLYDYAPSGFTLPGTIRLILTPGAACTIGGMSSSGAPDDTEVLIVNASATYSISFLHLASGETTAANQFSNANGETVVIPPLGAAKAHYVAGSINKWIFV